MRRERTPAVSSVRADGVTVVELVDRYDAVFTLGEQPVEAFAAGMTGFNAILVDAPQPFAAVVRPFVTRARRFFVVLEPTLLGVAGAQSMIADLQRFGVPSNRIALITNVRSAGEPVPRSEIESALQSQVVAEIPLLTSRTYAKSIAALQQYVESIPPNDALSMLQPSAGSPVGAHRNGRASSVATSLDVKRDELKQQMHQALLREVDLVSASGAHTDSAKLVDLRSKIESITSDLIAEHGFDGSAEELAELRQDIVDEALGLGPLEDLLKDDSITEIMVNGPQTIYVERRGMIERTNKHFSDSPAAADHRAHHHAARPPNRRILADGRRAASRRLARQRDHRTDRDRRHDDDDSALRQEAADRRRPDQDRRRARGGNGLSARGRPSAAQLHRQRRNRLRKDDLPQRSLFLSTG